MPQELWEPSDRLAYPAQQLDGFPSAECSLKSFDVSQYIWKPEKLDMTQFFGDSIKLGLDFATAPLQIGSNTVRGLLGEQPRDLWFSGKPRQQPERGRGLLANSLDTKRSRSSERTGPQPWWIVSQPKRAPSPEPRFDWDRQPLHLPWPNIGQQQSQSSEPSKLSQPGEYTRPKSGHQPDPTHTSGPPEVPTPAHHLSHELPPGPQPAPEPESEPAEVEPTEAPKPVEGPSSAAAPYNEFRSSYDQKTKADPTHALPSSPINDHQSKSESVPPPPPLSFESELQSAIEEPISDISSDSKQKPKYEREFQAVSPDNTPLPSKTVEQSSPPTKPPTSELASNSDTLIPALSPSKYQKPTSEPEQEMEATTYDNPNENQDATNMSDIDANEQAQGGRGKPTSALQSVPSAAPGVDRKRRLGPVQNPTLNKVRKEGEKDGSLKIRIELDLEVELELWARVKGDIVIGLL